MSCSKERQGAADTATMAWLGGGVKCKNRMAALQKSHWTLAAFGGIVSVWHFRNNGGYDDLP